MEFKNWFGKQDTEVDEAEIDRLYDKAHISVELVREYKPELLNNISTIANLASGAYGLYNSGENKKVLPTNAKFIFDQKHIDPNTIDLLPKSVIKQQFPEIDEKRIKESDTVHVNINRIVKESKTDLDAVLQIASTIVHECTHEIEREETGQTSEVGPQRAEREFMNWAKQNMKRIQDKYPELKGQEDGLQKISVN
jgi:hypothetical protein